MKYFSAVVNEDEIRASTLMPPYTILASYHYFKNKVELIKDCIKQGFDVFIDSGAFSAANSNKEIDINDYCQFITETGCRTYAGLDVVGDAQATKFNVDYMVHEKKLDPIPTFHLGSDPKFLLEILTYPYIALGGLVFKSGVEKYCDEVWGIILKEAPLIRVHGFGMTNADLMARYPWYSVDSSSFKGCKRFGRQQILWNGFEFKTFSEEEYLKILGLMGYDVENMGNKQKWFLYDFYSSQSYKIYGEHLTAINKIKKFNYLTAQTKLI